jgi:hypothetical protein
MIQAPPTCLWGAAISGVGGAPLKAITGWNSALFLPCVPWGPFGWAQPGGSPGPAHLMPGSVAYSITSSWTRLALRDVSPVPGSGLVGQVGSALHSQGEMDS